jgi:hypothetical protein
VDVLLVGNSSNLIGRTYGSFIDSFDSVIRFNGANPFRHPKALGIKTDYWSFSTMVLAQYQQWRIPGAVPMCLNMRITYPAHVPDAIMNDMDTYNDLIDGYGHMRPSTGLITAHYVSRKWDCNVSCIGFDFFKSDTWYRGSNEHIPHDGEREQAYIESLGVTIL